MGAGRSAACHAHAVERHGTRLRHAHCDFRVDRVCLRYLRMFLSLFRRDDDNELVYFGHCQLGERLNRHVGVRIGINQNK